MATDDTYLVFPWSSDLTEDEQRAFEAGATALCRRPAPARAEIPLVPLTSVGAEVFDAAEVWAREETERALLRAGGLVDELIAARYPSPGRVGS